MTTLRVLDVGAHAADVTGGRVMAYGPGWAWIRGDRGFAHVTNPRGPRGPLTAVVDDVPILAAGAPVQLALDGARRSTRTPLPRFAPVERIRDACVSVRPHLWNDPETLRLGAEPLEELVDELAGRGPGLTPAADDAICGFVATRLALEAAIHGGQLAPGVAANWHLDGTITSAAALRAAARTAEPSASLLRAAADGEIYEPAWAMLGALVGGEGPAIAPALRRLTGLGASTGRALLTGIVCALTAP